MELAKSLYLLRFEDVGEDEELVKLSLSTLVLPSSSTSGRPEPQLPCSSLPSCSSNRHNLDSFPSNNPISSEHLLSHGFDGDDHEEQLDLSLSLGDRHKRRRPCSSLPSSSVNRHSFDSFPSNNPSSSKRLLSLGFDDDDHEEELDLSLSLRLPGTSLSPALGDRHMPQLPCSSLPASSTAINHRNLDSFLSNNRSSGKRLFSFIFDGDDDEYHEDQQLDAYLPLRPPGSSSLDKSSSSSLSPSPSLNPNPIHQVVSIGSSSTRHQPQVRRNPFQTPKGGKSETIPAPFPWATTRRATVHDLNHLRSQGITMIAGDVECKGCLKTYKIEYKLEEKFNEIKEFISANKLAMHHRAPDVWMHPKLDNCGTCGNVLKPVTTKKREINWLFLLLGVSLGCCKLSELKYFCKHSKNHKTGAKNRVLFYTFLGLCKQLDPEGPFDID